MNIQILKADLSYIKNQLEELEKYLAEEKDEMDPSLIMIEDIILHVKAFMEEDL